MFCKYCGSDKVRLTSFGPSVIIHCGSCEVRKRYACLDDARLDWSEVWGANPHGVKKKIRKYEHWEIPGSFE